MRRAGPLAMAAALAAATGLAAAPATAPAPREPRKPRDPWDPLITNHHWPRPELTYTHSEKPLSKRAKRRARGRA